MDSGLAGLALGFQVALPAAATALARRAIGQRAMRAAGQRAMRAAAALAGLAMLGFGGALAYSAAHGQEG
jgi:hypothetical protein